MNTYNIKVINIADLRDAVNYQYRLNLSSTDVALALGKDGWTDGIHDIYFGPDIGFLLDETYSYLRDTFPNEENIWVNFG